MDLNKKIMYSIIGGLVITLVTGLLPTPTSIIGVGYWGLPFPWLSSPVTAQSVTNVIWANLFFNTVAWTVVTYIGMELFETLAKKKK